MPLNPKPKTQNRATVNGTKKPDPWLSISPYALSVLRSPYEDFMVGIRVPSKMPLARLGPTLILRPFDKGVEKLRHGRASSYQGGPLG